MTLAALFSQTTVYEHHYQPAFYNRVGEMRTGYNGGLLLPVLGNTGLDNSSFYLVVEHADGTSKLLPIEGYTGSESKLKYDLLPTPDGGLNLLFQFLDCDILFPWHIRHYNSSGIQEWSVNLQDILPIDKGGKLLPGSGNLFWLFRENDVPLLYQDSVNVESGPDVLPLFKGYRKMTGAVFVYGKSGLAKYNGPFSTIQTGLPGVNVLQADTLPGNKYIAVSKDTLYQLDADFNILKAIKHGIQGVADLDVDGNQCTILTTWPDAEIRRYNTNLDSLSTAIIPPDTRFFPRFLKKTGNRYLLAGESQTDLTSNQVIAVHSRLISALDWTTTADAGVTGITSPYQPMGSNFAGGYNIDFDSVSVWVKNNGNAPLQSVRLNALLSQFSWFCGPEAFRFLQRFDGLHVMPGDSILIPVGHLHWGKPDLTYPATTEICFWTTLPNDSLDHQPSNDQYCRTFSVVVPTSEPKELSPLSISPNPATDVCHIRLPEGNGQTGTLNLIDLTGRILRTERTANAEMDLIRGNLPSGVYWVQWTDPVGKVYFGKVIFE
jgi:hypothetical protein